MSTDETSTPATATATATAATAATIATTTPEFYYCYQCNLTITLTPSSSTSDLSCSNCNGGFLEHLENPNSFSYSLYSPFFSPPPSSAADHRTNFSPLLSPSLELTNPNPLQFLQNYLQSFGADGDGDGGGSDINLGDYFFGWRLEQLIQQLAENDPNRNRNPPAAVAGLPVVEVTEGLVSSDSSQCVVCLDEFEVGGEVKMMPCKHYFHCCCILPWLELHNSCPVCRDELPTDDLDYEQRAGRARRDGAGSSGNGNENENGG